MKTAQLTVALVQHRCHKTPEENLETLEKGIRSASREGAKLVLLQELHNYPYFCQTEETRFFDLAEAIPGATTERLARLAKELQLVIVASLFERRAAGVYHNTAAVLDTDGSLAGCYRKMHIPDDPGYHEKFYFTPGDLGFTPIDTSIGRLGVLICWDQWYPEAARLMALAGAELLLYPTAIGWDDRDDEAEQRRQFGAWRTIQQAHAIANGLPVLCCNRTGIESTEDGSASIHFWGGSFVAGPQGEILAEAPHNADHVLVTPLDMRHSEEIRRIWPYFRDRQIDAYGDLTLRFRD